MDQKEYLTVKEFAEQAKVSTQSVYKRMTTSLQPYIVEVDNQKMLQRQALADLYNIEVGNSCKPIQEEVTNDCKPCNEEKEQYEEQIRQLIDKVHELEVELIQKDALVKEKESRIIDLKQQHNEYVEKDKDHISDLQAQIRNQKNEIEVLHEELLLEKKSNMVLLAQKNDTEVAVVADRNEDHEPVQKKSWWRRWLGL